MINPQFDNIPAGDHMTASFGIFDMKAGWMPYEEYIIQKFFLRVQEEYFVHTMLWGKSKEPEELKKRIAKDIYEKEYSTFPKKLLEIFEQNVNS